MDSLPRRLGVPRCDRRRPAVGHRDSGGRARRRAARAVDVTACVNSPGPHDGTRRLLAIALVGGVVAAADQPVLTSGSAVRHRPRSADLTSNGRWQFWSAAVDAFEALRAPESGGGYEDYWAPARMSRSSAQRTLPRRPPSQGTVGIVLFLGFIGAVMSPPGRRWGWPRSGACWSL
jgi:hypothetical protein